ncbi:MAG: DUF2723 domain-containing protein [Bacteroidota bacterium]
MRWMQRFHGAALATAGCAFGVYLLTLAPSVSFIDSGELAAVACTLGIAHPTGYPLFTLLGWVASKVPLGEEIWRLNAMSALLCAGALLLFFPLFRRAAAGSLIDAAWVRRGHPAGRAAGAGAAAGTLLLAFSGTYWSIAVAVEVYALHIFLLAAMLFLFFSAQDEGKGGRRMLFAFVAGLAFANHLMTIQLAPALLSLFFLREGVGRRAWRRLAEMAIPFLLGLSVYLYLPLRAAAHPPLNWGDPAGPGRLLRHLAGRQYSVWFFSSAEAASRQFGRFLEGLPAELAYVGIPAAGLGLFLLAGGLRGLGRLAAQAAAALLFYGVLASLAGAGKPGALVWVGCGLLALAFLALSVFLLKDRPLLLGTLLMFETCIINAVHYDIQDIEPYFLLATCCLALWAACGFAALAGFGNRAGTAVRAGLVVAVGCAGLAVNLERADQSGNRMVEEYALAMLGSLPPNSLILSYQWDYWVSASYYYQHVKGIRRDVAVVDKELLRRSWYFEQLDRNTPWVLEGSRPEREAFLEDLARFEGGLPYEPARIEARYVGLIRSLLTRNLETRPVYVTYEIEPVFTSGLQRVPEGLAFRLAPDTSFHPTPYPRLPPPPALRRGPQEAMVPRLYAQALFARGAYYYTRRGAKEEALRSLRGALAYDSSHVAARRLLSDLGG